MNTTDLIYEYIVCYIKKHCYPPTIREICAGTHLKSTSNVHMHMKKLFADGRLETDVKAESSNRAYRLKGYKLVKKGNTDD